MKTYIKPVSEIVLLGTDAEILDKTITAASILDTDTDDSTLKDITPGNPEEWGGDAKGSNWNGWDD